MTDETPDEATQNTLTMPQTEFARSVDFQPGYNYLHETGPQSRGQHGMEIHFNLVGPEGAVSFALNTMWTPKGQVDEDDPRARFSPVHIQHYGTSLYRSTIGDDPMVMPPRGQAVYYHWRAPMFNKDDQPAQVGMCGIIGGPCYSDAGYLDADAVMELFIKGGDDVVWTALEERYHDRVQYVLSDGAGA